MRILIVCGGTGGHIFPACSLAHELKRRGRSDIVFIIDESAKTAEIVKDAGFTFEALKVPKMPYGLSAKWPSFFIRFLTARAKAERMIDELSPDVVVSFGAYISGPVVTTAKAARKKILIHEQNVTLGRANRLFLKDADRACFSFNNALLGGGDKYVFTGNPIRESLLKDFKTITRAEARSRLGLARNKKTLMVLGGSRGASAINSILVDMARDFKELDKDMVQVIHITGENDLEQVVRTYDKCRITHYARSFCERMGMLYKAADLIICRCGATTIAEICLFGIPAIFIPYPGAGCHQLENADFVAGWGGAIVHKQKDVVPEDLKTQILNLIRDDNKLKEMSAAMRPLARADATLRLADAVGRLVDA
ncbi:MAG: undecaprenyldiphospho-muramoylpentapeptide beta-N-acetylglucosaminyltransferase [Candidatus Omnitrophica bacterium]|nr:undecaprenyldiphospho-muramoylpentapeptide beta-N-acetylglucosaminyltransferase [Candidatus Omnitrophota bacterium]